MAEKNTNSKAKTTAKKTPTKKVETKKTTTTKTTNANKKASVKKVEAKKELNKKTTVKSSSKVASVNKAPVKKEVEKKDKVVDTYEAKLKENKKNSKFQRWLNSLTLEQIIISGFIVLAILLIILIGVATKNTKTTKGKDIVVSVNGKTITADELYKELKSQNGETVVINIIDEYILNKEYKTTDEMKQAAKSTIESYKNTYGDNYKSFLEYNGIKDDSELKDLLIKNSKLTLVTEDYIKNNLTEKEMKKYYDEKIVGDIEAKHILISYEKDENLTDEENNAKKEEAKKKAEELIERLKKGEDFSTLAKEYSDDKASKENGGSLGYFNTGDMVEAFETAAYNLDVNEYTTKPVETEYGYHIIMKTAQKDKPSYDKSKTTIKEKLIEEKKEQDSAVSAKAMVALRKKYKINIKDKTIKSDYNAYIKEATTTTTTTQASE